VTVAVVDADRRGAIIDLLAQPDPPELQGRGSHVTVEGRETRFQEWMWLPTWAVMLRREDISEVTRRPS
jgi:hypothetical protein